MSPSRPLLATITVIVSSARARHAGYALAAALGIAGLTSTSGWAQTAPAAPAAPAVLAAPPDAPGSPAAPGNTAAAAAPKAAVGANATRSASPSSSIPQNTNTNTGTLPVVAAPSAAASAPEPAISGSAVAGEAAALDARAQELKGEVIRLNRDLLVLEEELLFPASTQVAVFVSMDVGKLFELDSVQVRLDDKLVANYLYTPLEVKALHRGGVQRLFIGNLRTGEHQITAFFTGKGPHDRDYKRGTTLNFEKGSEPRYIELKIKDSLDQLQPEFDVKVWQ